MTERGMSQFKRWQAKIAAYTRAIDALTRELQGKFKGKVGREERREIGRIISHLRTRRTGLEKLRDVYLAKNGNQPAADKPSFRERFRKWRERF